MRLNTICVLMICSWVSVAHTKATLSKPSEQFFVLFDDGCEHPIEVCEVKTSLPTKLKMKKKYKSDSAYRGTVQIGFAEKNEAGIDAYEHYFSSQKSCERALKKANCGPAGDGG